MHYCDKNFKSKKALKEAVAKRLDYLRAKGGLMTQPPVTVHNPEAGMGGELPTPQNGTVCVGGPHFPEPHKWYAEVTLKDGEVIKVK
jgi:hypothetical protein